MGILRPLFQLNSKLTSASAQFRIPSLLKTRHCCISQLQNVKRVIFEGDGDVAGSDLCVVVWVYAFCLACMVTIGIITGVAEKKKEYGCECICHPSLQCICSLRSLLVITLFTFQQSLNEKLAKYLSTATDYCL